MQSDAATVAEYLAALPDDRRAALEAVRRTILVNLPAGDEEAMNWGMIVYEAPLTRCPDTYNGQRLAYAELASQENHMAVYLSGTHADDAARERFETAYRVTRKRCDVGKSCVRFREPDDLRLVLVGESIALFGGDALIGQIEEARTPRNGKRP